MIDIPGHPRIRDQFQEHLDDAKTIVFVVDASTISRNSAAVAELVSLVVLLSLTLTAVNLDTSTIFFMQ